MTALAAFLLLWAAVVGPRGGTTNSATSTAAVFLVGCLLVVTLGVRLMLGRGMSHRPTTLMLLASLALVGTNASAAAPALGRPALESGTLSTSLFLAYGVAIGAAGLTLAAAGPRLNRPTGVTSPRRIALFVALALVPPTAWAIEVSGEPPDNDRVASWVPTIVSAAFLLLLVTRLTLIARYADRRSTELAQRTTALADAVSEQTRLQHQLTFRAWHDPLTGLFNRDVLAERLAAALTDRPDRSAGPGRPRPCCCWTWTGSRTSTTPSATRSATTCWSRCPAGSSTWYRPGRRWPASAATSSPSSSPTSRSTRRWSGPTSCWRPSSSRSRSPAGTCTSPPASECW